MATARAGVFEQLPRNPNRIGEFIDIPPQMSPEELTTEMLEFIEAKGKINLQDAEIHREGTNLAVTSGGSYGITYKYG